MTKLGSWFIGVLFAVCAGIAAPGHAAPWECIEGLGESRGEVSRPPWDVLTVLESADHGVTPLVSARELQTLALAISMNSNLAERARPVWNLILTHRLQSDQGLAALVPGAALLWGSGASLDPHLGALLAHPAAGPRTADRVLLLLGSAPALAREPWAEGHWHKAMGLSPGAAGILGAALALPALGAGPEGMALLSTIVHHSNFHLKALEPLNALLSTLSDIEKQQAIAIISERLKGPSSPPALEVKDLFQVHYFLERAYGFMTDKERARWMEALIHIGDGGLGTVELLTHLRTIVGELHLSRRVINTWTALRYAKILERRAADVAPAVTTFGDYAQGLAAGLRLEGTAASPQGPRPSGNLRRIQ
jgi:hypothetical protein